MTAIAILAGMLLALTGLAAPSEAAAARAVSITATPSSGYPGAPVTFTGTLTNTPVGSAVAIQRKSGANWVKVVATKTTNAAGAFSYSTTMLTTAGAYSYRAFASPTLTRAAATSPTITVNVLRHTTATIHATPALVGAGDTSTLSGTVAPFVAGTTVTIQAQTDTGWDDVTTAPVSATGTFSATVTPEQTTTYRVSVPETGINGSTTSAGTSVTVGTRPVVTTTDLPDGDATLPYSATLAATGGPGTWSVSAGSLPAGITLAPSTGVLSGTPTTGGTSDFTVAYTATSTGIAGTKALSITVTPVPVVTTTTLPDATRLSAYTATLAKTGEDGTWAVTGLPAGLSLDAATGVISGTPNQLGDSSLTVTFTETATGRVATKALTLHVGGVGVAITTTTLNDATKAVAYSATLTKTGGDGTWAVTGLPAGLSVNATTGVISGTPSVTGDFTLSAKFTETASSIVATKALSLHVGATALAITTPVLPDATKGMAYSFTMSANAPGGTWSSYPLPAGLSLNASTGVISGTPTTSGDFSVYIGYTATNGAGAVRGYAFHIAPSPVITTTSLPDGTTGTPYSQQLAKTGNDGTWTLTSAKLPAGLTLSSSGLISGTPTTKGDYGFVVTFTETSTGYTDTQALLIHVSAPGDPVINTTSLANGTVGVAYSQTLSATGTGTWSLSYGTLPAGLTLNSTTGVISGTPTTAGDSGFIVQYTSGATYNTKWLTIHVAPAPPAG